MERPPAHTPTSSPARSGGTEHAFTLVEILVVLVIIGILMAVAVGSLRSPKRAANHKLVVSAAMAYQQGIAAFALDHAGRMPNMAATGGAQPDWSTSAHNGPVEPLTDPATGLRRTYIKGGAPEAVRGPAVTFWESATAPTAGARMPSSGRQGIIMYVPEATTPSVRYRLDVYVATAEGRVPSTVTCWIGTLPHPTTSIRPC